MQGVSKIQSAVGHIVDTQKRKKKEERKKRREDRKAAREGEEGLNDSFGKEHR